MLSTILEQMRLNQKPSLEELKFAVSQDWSEGRAKRLNLDSQDCLEPYTCSMYYEFKNNEGSPLDRDITVCLGSTFGDWISEVDRNTGVHTDEKAYIKDGKVELGTFSNKIKISSSVR